MRGAVRKGWHLAHISQQEYFEKYNLTFLGLRILLDSACTGHWVSSYDPSGKDSKFAFEKESDLTWFVMKFNISNA